MPGVGKRISNCVEVVDFAVEHDPEPSVRGTHRLLPAGDVDNGETTVPHDGMLETLLPVLVRPSVADGGVHPFEQGFIGQAISRLGVCDNKAAHQPILNGNRGSIVTMRRSVMDRFAASSACADTRKLSV